MADSPEPDRSKRCVLRFVVSSALTLVLASTLWFLLRDVGPGLPAHHNLAVASSTGLTSVPRRSPVPSRAATKRRNPVGVVDQGDVAASPVSVALGEVSIAVDRFDTDRVVAAAMSLLPDGRIWTMASDDGGKSWSTAQIPLSSGTTFHADPMVTFDSQGVAHLVHIPVVPPNSPVGIEVNQSQDGGRTWSATQRISATTGDDKVIVVADDHPESPFRDHVYVAWKLPAGGVFFSRSENGGLSYLPPQEISPVAISGLDLATDHDGAVYLAANSGSEGAILLFRSLDGGFSFESARRVASVRAGWYTMTPSACTRMALVHASIGVDRSEGAGRGNLYVSWSDYPVGSSTNCDDGCSISRACSPDVFVSRSVDRGVTWDGQIVASGVEEGTADQYHQWLDVDPETGSVYVGYKDTRDDPNRLSTHVYLSWSDDAGESFHSPVRISSAPSVARTNFQYGDYQGLAAAGGRVYTAWADFRDSPTSSRIQISRVDFVDGLSARPEALDFGEVDVGRKARRKLVVTNHGDQEVDLLDLRIRGRQRKEFELKKDRCSGARLAPEESCRFKVRVRPTSAGSRSGVVVVDASESELGGLRIDLLATAIDDGA